MADALDSCPLVDILLADVCACGHPGFSHRRGIGTDKYNPSTKYKCQEEGCDCAVTYNA